MIPANKGRKFPSEPLTQDEVKKLIGACSRRAVTGTRNRAILAIMYRGGLRVGEALSLLPKDLDYEQSTVRVLQGKGQKARVVGLDAGAWAIIALWQEKRAALGIGPRSPLFCTLKGMPMRTSYMRMLLPRLAKKAGIERRCHCHALRHAHAFELANERTPLHEISHQLGHASVSTTDRYIRHLNPVVVIERMKAREWSL
jgi:site-specific recombinase XerD